MGDVFVFRNWRGRGIGEVNNGDVWWYVYNERTGRVVDVRWLGRVRKHDLRSADLLITAEARRIRMRRPLRLRRQSFLYWRDAEQWRYGRGPARYIHRPRGMKGRI